MVVRLPRKKNPLAKYHGSFSCIESKLKEWPIIGFDSEDNSKGIVTLFGFYSDNGPFVTKHHEEAIDYIYDVDIPTYFVAHNLEYDVINFFKHDSYDYIDDMVYAGTKLLKMTLKGCPHVFIDSTAFFRGSLKALGDFVGLPKLDGDAYDESYVARDAQIAYKFLKEFQTKLIKEEGVNLGITIGQMSMALYRRSYMLNKTQITYNSPNCLEAFYGGRVELFYIGTLDKGVSMSDINSCYPFVMKEYMYPDTSYIEPSTIDTHEYGIGRFKVDVPKSMFIPVLPHKDKKSGRLFFPTGIFEGWWTYAEVRYAVSLGVKILKEYEGEGTNSGVRPFEEYIEVLYNKRLKAKATSDMFGDLLYKLWQNNLYGKWVQHHAGGHMTREKIPEHKIAKYVDHPEFDTKKIGPFYWYKIPKDKPPKTANYLWGVYVTSYARIFLHRGIMAISKAGFTPVYCDTDSIMYTSFDKRKIKNKTPLPLSKKLGDWDLETFDLGVFRQAKAYILYRQNVCDLATKKLAYYPVKSACKGVPTDYAYDFVIKSMAIFEKPIRLKEGLLRTFAEVNKDKDDEFLFELGANMWHDVEKKMKSIYVKRRGTNGITYPQDVNDVENLVKNSVFKDIAPFEIGNYNLVKPDRKNAFTQKSMPENYFGEKPSRHYANGIPVALTPHKLGFNECLDIDPGEIWFAGYPLRIVYRKGGESIVPNSYNRNSKRKYYFQILVTKYRNKPCPEHFIAEISLGVLTYGFRNPVRLIEKYFTISLKDFYIGKGYPNFQINFSESTLSSLAETENELDKIFGGAEVL